MTLFSPFADEVKPDFHSRISLVFSKIFVSESWKNKSNLKILHLSSEIVVFGGHLPKEVLVEGFCGVTIRCLKIFRRRRLLQR